MIGNSTLFYLLLVVNVLLSVGCINLIENQEDDYLCHRYTGCSLPEQTIDGKALIYIIRPISAFNNSERHNLYITDGAGLERHVSRITGSTYCVHYASPGSIRLRTDGGFKGGELTLNVHNGAVYYVLHDVYTSLTSFKLGARLKEIDSDSGERLLRNVGGKCFN
jgi:hypothetical protein